MKALKGSEMPWPMRGDESHEGHMRAMKAMTLEDMFAI